MEFDAVRADAAYRAVDQASRVEGASPHALVVILFEEALDQIDIIAAGLTRGRRPDEAQVRAHAILHALEAGLDHRAAGPMAALLATVYRETRRCIQRAADQTDPFWCKRARETMEPVASAWRDIAQAA
jgi:flagellar secretion chaperone FliS